jgi:hypothetical protein
VKQRTKKLACAVALPPAAFLTGTVLGGVADAASVQTGNYANNLMVGYVDFLHAGSFVNVRNLQTYEYVPGSIWDWDVCDTQGQVATLFPDGRIEFVTTSPYTSNCSWIRKYGYGNYDGGQPWNWGIKTKWKSRGTGNTFVDIGTLRP